MSLLLQVVDHLKVCIKDVGEVTEGKVEVTGHAFTLVSEGTTLGWREGEVPAIHGVIEVDRADLLRILEVLEVAQDPRPGGVYMKREAWVRDRDDALAQLRELLT